MSRIATPLLSFIALAAPIASAEMETLTVTANREPTAVSELATSLSVLDSSALATVSHTHISELMQRVPGVWVNRGNGQESLIALRSPVLTGAGSCGAFLVTEDGVAARAAGFCNVNQLFDLNTEQAGSIDILRGPGTAVHGNGAQHGVINVLSEAPSQQLQQRVTLEGGPHDYGRIKYSISNSSGQHGVRFSANGSHDNGYQDDSGYDQQKATLRHDYQGQRWQFKTLLSASNINQETGGYVTGKDAYKDDALKKINANPEAFRDSQSLRWQTRLSTTLADGSHMAITPYARYTDMRFAMHFLPGKPIEENGQQSAGLLFDYRLPLTPSSQLMTGFDTEYTHAYLEQWQASGFGPFPSGQQYDYQVDALLAAAFATLSVETAQSTRIEMGARAEYLRYDYDNRMVDGNTAEDGTPCPGGCRYSRPADRSDSFDDLSFNLAVLQPINDSLTAKARLAQSYRAPQATELYRLQAGQRVADIDSEKLNSLEFGLRGNFEQWTFDLTAFAMKKRNVIFQDSERRNIDNGETEHHGLEYAVNWQWHRDWSLAVNGSYALQRYASNISYPGSSAMLQTEGNDIDTAPRHMGSAQLAWQASKHTLLELEWVYMGSYYTDITNEHRYDGHNLWHLRLQQQLNEHWQLGLRLLNVADTDYAERADYSGFDGDRYFVGEPRSLYVDISAQF
jgi:outer membrane receptor protein involved in Fe transport